MWTKKNFFAARSPTGKTPVSLGLQEIGETTRRTTRKITWRPSRTTRRRPSIKAYQDKDFTFGKC